MCDPPRRRGGEGGEEGERRREKEREGERREKREKTRGFEECEVWRLIDYISLF